MPIILKVRNVTGIRNRYNQAPHLTQDTTWESDKTQLNITNESQKVNPFPAGDHKAAMNRRETYLSLASFLWKIGKQCRPRSDPAERGI